MSQTFKKRGERRSGALKEVITDVAAINTDASGLEIIVIGLRHLVSIQITVTLGYSISFSVYSDGMLTMIVYQSAGSAAAHAALANEDGDLGIAAHVVAKGY